MTNIVVPGILNALGEVLKGTASNLIKLFPIAIKSTEAAYLARVKSFDHLSLHELLLTAAKGPGDHRDFVAAASIGSWAFKRTNPFAVLCPLYDDLCK